MEELNIIPTNLDDVKSTPAFSRKRGGSTFVSGSSSEAHQMKRRAIGRGERVKQSGKNPQDIFALVAASVEAPSAADNNDYGIAILKDQVNSLQAGMQQIQQQLFLLQQTLLMQSHSSR